MAIGRRVDNPVVAEFHEARMGGRKPAGYAEVIMVLDDLPVIVREARRRKGLSLRAAQAESGVDQATILNAERGGNLTMANVRALLAWAAT
jgi:ribosome-binding protein aMBF1 (putative translation factor)